MSEKYFVAMVVLLTKKKMCKMLDFKLKMIFCRHLVEHNMFT